MKLPIMRLHKSMENSRDSFFFLFLFIIFKHVPLSVQYYMLW
jgi:hypothetical protein